LFHSYSIDRGWRGAIHRRNLNRPHRVRPRKVMVKAAADYGARRNRDLAIRQLTPDLLDDFLDFFDHAAFTDNPLWSGCYCMYYHFMGTEEEWEKRSASENRETVSKLIGEGKAHGLLAYANGRPVGWCHAAPRTAIPRLKLYQHKLFQQFRVEDPERVGSIVCFVIAKPYRGRGIARRLVDTACEVFTRQGLAFAEAYPRKKTESDADKYAGPLNMYLKARFSMFRELERYVIVRKALL